MSESLKELSRLLKESKLKITEFNAASKAEGVRKEEYEKRLIQAMDAAGTTTVVNEFGNFGRQETVMPVPKDWEAIYQYVKENNAFHLLYRQIGGGAYREILAMGEMIPGIESYTKVSITVRKPK